MTGIREERAYEGRERFGFSFSCFHQEVQLLLYAMS
jgi:hypothetical protein